MSGLHNYSIDKQRAIEQLLEMNKRAKKHDAYTEDKTTPTHNQHIYSNFAPSFINLPLDSDTVTILALMLILYTNSSDTLLIFALAYILI